jgi:serine/threonine protein kinase
MSWLVNYIWGPKIAPPPPFSPNLENFVIIGYARDETLVFKTESYHPNEKDSFFKAIEQQFHLSYVSDLKEGEYSKAFHVTFRRGEVAEPMMLQMIKINQIPTLRHVTQHFSLDKNNDHTGIDWHLFLSPSSPLPEPQYAIAWSTTQAKFIVLTKEEIKGGLEGEHILYATLTPYQERQTPFYTHPLIPFDTYDTISPFCPVETLFPFVLASYLRNLKIEKFLGEGAFSKVWAVTFTNPQGKSQRTTLRLPKIISCKKELIEKYYQIRKERFGGEFGAFLPQGPYNINSYYAIVFDENQKRFRILKRDEIRDLYDHPEKIGENTYTLFGILGEYHEGAKTLTEFMKEQGKFEIEKIREYAYQFLLALNEFKNLKIIHRDIKPDNILILRDKTLKIFDFGLAATGIEPGQEAQSFLGTPVYMSPEILNRDSYDHSVDRYAVYCILFQMATREHPCPNVKTMAQLKEAVEKIDLDQDPRLENLPPSFRTFLKRLGDKDRKARWEEDRLLNEDPFLQVGAPPPAPHIETPLPSFTLSQSSQHNSSTPPPSLLGRVAKLVILAGIVFVLYHFARRLLTFATRPHFPKGKPL